MSEDNNQPEEVQEEETNQSEDQVIPAKIYESTKSDMLKYKSEVKELKSRLAQFDADREAEKKAQMLENKQYEKLYKQTEEKLKTLQQERQDERIKFIDGHKVNAAVQAIGGFKKPEYTRFINKDAIQLNEDGSVDQASLESEVARIKKEYTELVKAQEAPSLPNQAPTGIQPRKLQDLSEEERNELRRKLLKQ